MTRLLVGLFATTVLFTGTATFAQSPGTTGSPGDLPLAVRGGAAAGPAQLTLYCDLEEEACANIVVVLSRIIETYPEQAGVTFRHLASAEHERSPLGYRAALAAARQGKGWPLLDMACANPDRLTAGGVRSMAEQLRLDLPAFLSDIKSADVADVLADDAREAESARLAAVPALFLNGERLADVKTFDAIEAAVKAVIK